MAIDSLSQTPNSMIRSANLSGLTSSLMAEGFSSAVVGTEKSDQPKPLNSDLSLTLAKKQTQSESQPSLDEKSLQRINESLQKAGSNILFETDKDSGRMLFLMKDAESGETIRQIPSEVVLKISQAIDDFLNQAPIEGKSTSDSGLASALSGLVTNLKA